MAPKKNKKLENNNVKPRKISGCSDPLNQPLFPFTASNPHLVTLGSSVRPGGTELGTVADPKLLNLTVGSGVTDIFAKKPNLITYDPKLLSDVVVSPGNTPKRFISTTQPNFQNSTIIPPNDIVIGAGTFDLASNLQHSPYTLSALPKEVDLVATYLQFSADTPPWQRGILSTLPHQPGLLSSMGLSFNHGDTVLGNGKSWKELEKEERDVEIKKMQQKFEERNSTLEVEIKQTKERADKTEKARIEDRAYFEAIIETLRQAPIKTHALQTSKGFKKENITFNVETGAVYALNRKIGVLEPRKADYYLFNELFESLPCTIDYKSLATAVHQHLSTTANSKTDESYCQSIKSSINKYAPEVAALIKSFNTLDGKRGYKLESPERQKRARS